MGDLYTALFPIRSIATFVGLSTQSRSCISRYCFYAFILTITISGMVYNYSYYSSRYFANMSDYVRYYKIYISMVFMLFVTFLYPLRRHRLEAVWETILSVDRSLERLGISVDNKKLRNYNAAVTFLAFLLISIMTISKFSMTEIELMISMMEVVVYFVDDVYKCTFELFFHANMMVIHQRFKLLNTALTRNAKNESFIREAAKTHLKLISATEEFVRIYSRSNVLQLGVNFVYLVTRFYSLCTYLFLQRSYSNEYIFQATFWMLFYVFCFIMTVSSCALVTNQANYTKNVLVKISPVRYIQKEINSFAIQLFYTDLKLTAGGFFLLDFTLVYSMIGAMSTYLVMLIQFDTTFQRESIEALL